jgi:hypothetical protein
MVKKVIMKPNIKIYSIFYLELVIFKYCWSNLKMIDLVKI